MKLGRSGLQVHPREFAETVMATSALDPAAGWINGVVGVHPYQLAYADPRVAAVTLSDGSTVPVEQISICDDHVELKSATLAAATTGRTATTGDAVTEERIPIVEEQIKVGKRAIERGSVRVSALRGSAPASERPDRASAPPS